MNSPQKRQSTGLLAWFASNPVAANLLMVLILIGGMTGYVVMDKEVFPRFNPQQIDVTTRYPGAGPLEIEESVCVRIEESINDLPGIKRLYAEIRQGECNIKVSVLPEYDPEQVLKMVWKSACRNGTMTARTIRVGKFTLNTAPSKWRDVLKIMLILSGCNSRKVWR